MKHDWLLKTFGETDHKFYYVGGCVRDELMGVTPKDYDIATDATPDEVERLFTEAGHRVVRTGESFGGVTLIGPGGESIECTTFRGDGTYTDRRHPDNVVFVKTIEEDLARRDFRVNAMARDPWTQRIIDPYGGQHDIREGVLRCVGNPIVRFAEDPLRVMRAMRFAALGFEITDETRDAMRATASLMNTVPVERFQAEVMKAMATPYPWMFFREMQRAGYLPIFFPELDKAVGMKQKIKYHKFDVFAHSLLALRYMSGYTKDPMLRLITMLHDYGKPACRTMHPSETFNFDEPKFLEHERVGALMVADLLRRLRWPERDVERAQVLIHHHMVPYDGKWSDGTIRRWKASVDPYWDDLMLLRRADLYAHGHNYEPRLELLTELRERVRALKDVEQDTVPKLAITGDDVMRVLGLSPGPAVGTALRKLREVVTDDPEKNTAGYLEAYLRTNM